MRNFCTVDTDGKITQIAIGFKEAPFEQAHEIINEIANAPNEWVLQEGNWIRVSAPEPEPEPPEPTIEEILLAALLEIQTLKNKVVELEGKLDA